MKNCNGVTMIALIVTIVVLIILSTVTITTTVNTGIVKNTQELSQEAEINNLKENLKMDLLAEKNKTGSSTISYSQVENVLRQNITSEDDLIKDVETGEITGIKTQSGYEINMSDIREYMNEEAHITLQQKQSEEQV